MRDFDEMKLCGDFKLIYPNEQIERQFGFEEFILAAQTDWNDFTTGRGRKKGPFVPSDPNDIIN